MKTYRKAKSAMGKELDQHVVVLVNGVPAEMINKKFHPEKWAEYEASLGEKPAEDKPKKAGKKKKSVK